MTWDKVYVDDLGRQHSVACDQVTSEKMSGAQRFACTIILGCRCA